MRKSLLLIPAVSLLLSGAVAASAATVKKSAKPAPKPAPKSGTVQLAGDNGVFGTVYSINKGNPIYFRLKSVEFTTNQVTIGENLYVPSAEEKLMVLHFTVQNPQKTEQFVRWDTLRFTAADAMNTNHEGDNEWGDE
jgi:hypothetical protein